MRGGVPAGRAGLSVALSLAALLMSSAAGAGEWLGTPEAGGGGIPLGQLSDICPGLCPRLWRQGDWALMGSLPQPRIFFAANDAYVTLDFPVTRGMEVWSSDGTRAGTAIFADLNPGTGDSSPTNFAVLEKSTALYPDGRDTLLFIASGDPAAPCPCAGGACTTYLFYTDGVDAPKCVDYTSAAVATQPWLAQFAEIYAGLNLCGAASLRDGCPDANTDFTWAAQDRAPLAFKVFQQPWNAPAGNVCSWTTPGSPTCTWAGP